MLQVAISITMMSEWVCWCLKSPASQVFAQLFVQAQIKESIKAQHPGVCEGNSHMTSEFLAQMASNVENGSIFLCHHAVCTVNIPQRMYVVYNF